MWIYHMHIQSSKAKATEMTFPWDFLDINADILGHWLFVDVQTYKCCSLHGARDFTSKSFYFGGLSKGVTKIDVVFWGAVQMLTFVTGNFY